MCLPLHPPSHITGYPTRDAENFKDGEEKNEDEGILDGCDEDDSLSPMEHTKGWHGVENVLPDEAEDIDDLHNHGKCIFDVYIFSQTGSTKNRLCCILFLVQCPACHTLTPLMPCTRYAPSDEVMYSDIARNLDVCIRCYTRMSAAARSALSPDLAPHSFVSRETERRSKNLPDIDVVCDVCNRKGTEFAEDNIGHAAKLQVEKPSKCSIG